MNYNTKRRGNHYGLPLFVEWTVEISNQIIQDMIDFVEAMREIE